MEDEKTSLELDNLAAKLRRIKEMRGCMAGMPSPTEMLLEERRREHERELTEEGTTAYVSGSSHLIRYIDVKEVEELARIAFLPAK